MAIDSFEKEWNDIKKNFERATTKKKPSEKFLGIFNKPSGITPAARTFDKALDDESRTAADKALAGLDRVANAYVQVLAKASATETDNTVKAEAKVMIGEIHELLAQAEKATKKIGVLDHVNSLAEWTKQIKSKSLGPKITTFAKSTHREEIVLFLATMAKRDHSKSTYKTFIDVGGKLQINIDESLREKFNPDDLDDAPWGDATTFVLGQYNDMLDKIK